MRVQYDVMVQEFARVLEKKGCLLYTSSVFITVGGGIYFLYLLLGKRRVNF